MNLSLEQRLNEEQVNFTRLEKREKVKLLTRWCKTFPELLTSARTQRFVPVVELDAAADQSLSGLTTDEYYLLPDDDSAMPSYRCVSPRMPDLADLVSDVGTKCDEIVIVDASFLWSAVFVNHGSPHLIGRHFLRR
jgi:hypothetical protein